MSTYSDRPWLKLYQDWMPSDITPEFDNMLDLLAASVRRAPETVAIKYFDGQTTLAELDSQSNAVAVALTENGFGNGDLLALYVQNDPAFVIGLIAAWKAGGGAVAVNPMNKGRELAYILEDSGAVALLCLEDLYTSVAAEVLSDGATAVKTVITCSGLDGQTRDDPRIFSGGRPTMPAGTLDLAELIERYAGRVPSPASPSGDDVAVLTYTSGTTGVPKGAMNTHANMAFNSQTYRDWVQMTGDDVIYGVAPLFHITGLVAHIGLGLLVPCPLVLNHQFEPSVVIDAIREHRPTFTVGAITVFINLVNNPDMAPEDWSSFRALFSGGAAIAPTVIDRFRDKTGLYIHTVYGLTETTSPSHGVPYGMTAPVDPVSGALSVGLPTFNTTCRIIDEDGQELPVGEPGEIVISGPQVIPGYWRNPEATAESIPGGELRTGDIGFMDEQGWFYIVDRKKDMINASGYKVWPREVEDVLYSHPAIREVAVVGVPDEYRGETVMAYASVQAGSSVTEQELIDFCKARMAAYKYPRTIKFLDDLPKTTTGKILRRELRQSRP